MPSGESWIESMPRGGWCLYVRSSLPSSRPQTAVLSLGILGVACGLAGLPWACLSLACCACWFGWWGRDREEEAEVIVAELDEEA